MAKVSYEILTKVSKSYHYKALRAYVVAAQIIVDGVPYPMKVQIPAGNIKTDEELKNAIIARMDEIKATHEKKFDKAEANKTGKEPVKLPATGAFKDVLSTVTELSK